MRNVKTNQMNARRCNSEGAGVKMTSWLNNNFKLLALTLLAVLSVNVVWGEEVTINVSDNLWTTTGGAQSGTKSGITISTNNGARNSSNDYRVYKNEQLTVSSSVGKITNIAITYTSASYDGGGWASSYQPNAATWTSPTANGEQARMTKIVVTTAASKTLTSISVKTAPSKTTYTEGDKFDPTGLVITKTYSDASTEDWAYASHASDFTFNPTTSAALTTSNTSVTITVGGKNTTQTITVNAKPKYTVKFYNAGEVVKTVSNVVDGTLFSAIKPTIGTGSGQLNIESCDNSSTHFMGWTTESFQKRGNAPSYVADNDAINDDMELRAVWAKEDEE